jgi:hypothetical protein
LPWSISWPSPGWVDGPYVRTMVLHCMLTGTTNFTGNPPYSTPSYSVVLGARGCGRGVRLAASSRACGERRRYRPDWAVFAPNDQALWGTRAARSPAAGHPNRCRRL